MGLGLLAVSILLYVGVAADYALKGNVGMAVSFAGYAIGNAGIAYATHRGLV
jgi:hypothetical protein